MIHTYFLSDLKLNLPDHSNALVDIHARLYIHVAYKSGGDCKMVLAMKLRAMKKHRPCYIVSIEMQE